MASLRFGLRLVGAMVTAALVAALLPGPTAWAQTLRVRSTNAQVSAQSDTVSFELSGSVAAVPSGPAYHIFPANTEAGRHAALTGPVGRSKRTAPAAKGFGGLAVPGFFPADLALFGNNPLVVRNSNSENIYYNCADESCWGDPEGFLIDLAASKFIHVTDQYVGVKSNNRYPLSSTIVTATGGSTFLTSDDVVNLVHDAVALAGVGPGHIFHLFLPQGVDTCMDAGNTSCYSPDNPSTFTFCGYHSFATFNDLGPQPVTVLYTVEPFEDVSGCVLAPPPRGYPNGELADSTNSVLSHELFETITDPFPGGNSNSAWIAQNSAVEDGKEVGDICQGAFDNLGEIVPTYTLVRGRTYQTQLEYSNSRHGCVVAP